GVRGHWKRQPVARRRVRQHSRLLFQDRERQLFFVGEILFRSVRELRLERPAEGGALLDVLERDVGKAIDRETLLNANVQVLPLEKRPVPVPRLSNHVRARGRGAGRQRREDDRQRRKRESLPHPWAAARYESGQRLSLEGASRAALWKRDSEKRGSAGFLSRTLSATISPRAGPCLNPWPDPPPTIQTFRANGC